MENLERENADIIQHYENLGYRKVFRFEGGKLIDELTEKGYASEQIFILEEHKLEQQGQPSDSTILMIFKTDDDMRGMFLMDRDDAQNRTLKDFFKNIPEKNYVENEEAKPTRPQNP